MKTRFDGVRYAALDTDVKSMHLIADAKVVACLVERYAPGTCRHLLQSADMHAFIGLLK